MTIFEAYNDIKSRLKAAGIEDFVFEAKQIIKYVTGYTNKEILLNYAESLNDFQIDCLNSVMSEGIFIKLWLIYNIIIFHHFFFSLNN